MASEETGQANGEKPKPTKSGKRNRRAVLTENQKQNILKLSPSMTALEIAHRLGLDFRVVNGFIRKNRLADAWGIVSHLSHKLSDAQREAIIAQRLAGKTLAEIAHIHGVTSPAIHKIVKQVRLERRTRKGKLTLEQIEEAIARRHAGELLEAIGAYFGVTASSIHRLTQHAAPPTGWKRAKRPKKPGI